MAIFGCRVWSLSICGVGFGVLEVFGRVVSYTMEGRKETRDTVRGRGWDAIELVLMKEMGFDI